MRKLFRLYIILTMTIVLLPLDAKVFDAPFRWADDEDYRPLIYLSETGKAEGILYDILSEVFKRMHIKFDCKLYPWSRAQKMVKDGKADGMVTVYTEERRKLFKATDPIVVVNEHLFTNHNNPKIKEILNIKSIEGLKRYIVVETIGSGWTKEQLKRAKIIWVPTAQSAINMIASKRADIFLMSDYSGQTFLEDEIGQNSPLKDKLKEVVAGKYSIAKLKYRLLIRKNSPYVDIIDTINKTLLQMHKDGTYKKIMKRHNINIK